jgi:CRISPR-associated exonuclease Cas4
MRQITGTWIAYYSYCKRRMWLFANGINMESNSDLVYEGKLIHENSYTRRSERYQEIELDGIKIDYFDPKTKTIHEIKKSDKFEQAHEWQLKYYMFVFEKNGINDIKGILEYPILHSTKEITLSNDDRIRINDFIAEITSIVQNEVCPAINVKSRCKNCSYFDFCWSTEMET